MKIIVQKFGGTSVASKTSRLHCYKHIENALALNYKVVVVVSAMGRKGEPYATDTLLNLVPGINNREKDILLNTGELISACVFSSELTQNGIANMVLSGGQAGIITNNNFNESGIIDLRPERILNDLDKVDVVIVAGFQGISPDNELTTLGRGGSDTSATAIGASLNAEYVDIFTDVKGIMTADPRIVEQAQIIEKTTYNEICNLAYMGAKVIHPRAVEIAMQFNIPIRVRSTFENTEGTLISNYNEMDNVNSGRVLTGITVTKNITQFSVTQSLNFSEKNSLFNKLDELKVSLDLININPNMISFTVKIEHSKLVCDILKGLNLNFIEDQEVSKISLVGSGMSGVPGVIRKIVNTLYEKQIPILQTTDSNTTIWILVPKKDEHKAIINLHDAFELHKKIVR